MKQEEQDESGRLVKASRPQITMNFNSCPIGQQIAHVDKIVANFDKDMNMHIVDVDEIAGNSDESAVGDADTSALAPLSWQRLLDANFNGKDMAWVKAKLKRIYSACYPNYFVCTEEEFLACFGLLDGRKPRRIEWLGGARGLNYFIKKLYPTKAPSWEQVAALFVKRDGTQYNGLGKQLLTDEEEKHCVDQLFEKILQ